MTTQPSNDATRRNLSPEQMDNARHWIRMHRLNVESWDKNGKPHPHDDVNCYDRKYSASRMVYWANVLLLDSLDV